MARKAVVLSSGGLDSTTVMAIAHSDGYELYAISYNYGQRHKSELAAAEDVAKALDVKEHILVRIDLRQFGGSALTGELDVPKHDSVGQIGSNIPTTYVPARNTIFLSFALGWAEVLGAHDIFLGVNALDYSGYPDCRPEYIEAYEWMANLATKTGIEAPPGKRAIKIHAPLIHMTKKDIILKGLELGIDYGLTHSCYDPSPDGIACGHCEACLLRLRGFLEAGVEDPVRYQQTVT